MFSVFLSSSQEALANLLRDSRDPKPAYWRLDLPWLSLWFHPSSSRLFSTGWQETPAAAPIKIKTNIKRLPGAAWVPGEMRN